MARVPARADRKGLHHRFHCGEALPRPHCVLQEASGRAGEALSMWKGPPSTTASCPRGLPASSRGSHVFAGFSRAAEVPVWQDSV